MTCYIETSSKESFDIEIGSYTIHLPKYSSVHHPLVQMVLFARSLYDSTLRCLKSVETKSIEFDAAGPVITKPKSHSPNTVSRKDVHVLGNTARENHSITPGLDKNIAKLGELDYNVDQSTVPVPSGGFALESVYNIHSLTSMSSAPSSADHGITKAEDKTEVWRLANMAEDKSEDWGLANIVKVENHTKVWRLANIAKAGDNTEGSRLANIAKEEEKTEGWRLANIAEAEEKTEDWLLVHLAKTEEKSEDWRLASIAKAEYNSEDGRSASVAKAEDKTKDWRLASIAKREDKTEVTWLMATAAVHHATGIRDLLSGFTTVKDLFVKAGDGVSMPVCGRGSVTTGTVVLQDVWFVPGLTENLVSVTQLTELDYSVGFSRAACIIKSAADDVVIGKAHVSEDGLFELDFLKVGPVI